ncbi:nitric oxide synthase [Curtobacterium albidum]|uniref:Nitric oxide synthase n=1 Tax=Curtobacterium citreum TaxID=2036 RepID=A0A850DUD7_9MICO|nr:flavodoxin domain-containing protein [Curtobacterium albidum]NUU27192.1 nitric oxide synthase [Curtobacterium albidum]
MSALPVLFGTESGNAELVADDIADLLNTAGLDAEAVSMEDFNIHTLTDLPAIVLITSTYGEGELPATTAPFVASLIAAGPDLSGLHFAAFGLGDSSYDTYNNAIEILIAQFTAFGATQIGSTGRHDAASGEPFTDGATEWATHMVSSFASTLPA